MSKTVLFGVALALAALSAGLGFWFGRQTPPDAGAGKPAAPVAVKAEPRVLYYRNPMGLPDTSPVPKKDAMGMDYVPVFEGEGKDGGPESANQVTLSVEKVQKLGVKTEAASVRVLDNVVRAAGRVEVDERRVFEITPKFEGYVERLHVNASGQPVARGQALFEVYSPELVATQREYAIAAQGEQALRDAGSEARQGMKQLAESSLLRLRNWDVPEQQIRALAKSGEVRRTLSFRSPVAGIVTEKKAVQGMRFLPGDMLYRVADLSSVWVMADVFERDIGLIAVGAKATATINAYPGKVFEGRIAYVYPTLNPETRTVSVRLELVNRGGLLKPAMFAQVELPVAGKGRVVSIPDSAVIDSGTRRIVLVQLAEGRFEPRDVRLGARGDNYVEVLEGVAEGERVVVTANFLIDAESNLKAAIAGFGHAGHGSPATPEAKVPPAPPAGDAHSGH